MDAHQQPPIVDLLAAAFATMPLCSVHSEQANFFVPAWWWGSQPHHLSWYCDACCRYGCYLVFQLRTHHDLFCAEDEDEEPVMTFPGSMVVLAGITIAVAVCSE